MKWHSLPIAKQRKSYIIGETLVKPDAMQLAKIMLGKEAENKLFLVPLLDDVVKSRINDIGEDILSQVVADSKASPTKFIIQLDETTDVTNLNQLIAFVRYVKGKEIKEEFFFRKQLPRKHRVIGRILFQYSTVSVVSVSEKDKQTLLDQYSFRIVFLYKLV